MLFDGSSYSSMMDLFNYIVLFCGIYCFYAWYQLRSDTIPERFPLLAKDLRPEKCLDQAYYISYIRPRLLIFAIIVTVLGVFSIVDTKFGLCAALFPEGTATAVSAIVGSFLPFMVVVWFGVCMYKIQKELWP